MKHLLSAGIIACILAFGLTLSVPSAIAGNDTCIGSPAGCTDITDNSTTNQGGSAIGVNVNANDGGDVYRSGNSRNKNTNKNTNDNRSKATSIQGQQQGQLQGQSTDVSINNERAASSAIASPLVAGSDCMGSTSIGGSGLDFGLVFGTTWEDDTCQRLKLANAALALGQALTAFEIMCDDEKFRAAARRGGRMCAIDRAEALKGINPATLTPSSSTTTQTPVASMEPIPNE